MRESVGRPIALVVASMHVGGVERMTITLAREFLRRGVAVDLVLFSRKGPLLDQVPAGVRIFGLGEVRARQAVRPLRQYLKRERPAAVLSAAWEPNLATLVASLGLRSPPRIVLSVRNTFSLALAGNSFGRRIMRLATKILYHRADHVAAVSIGAAEDLRQHVGLRPDRVGAIYNPALPDDFERLASEPADLFDAPQPGVARIVTVGRLAPAKDQANLIRAFATVLEHRPAELFLFGEGEMRPALEALTVELGVADRVKFAGMVSNPFPYMRAADLFVFSSAWEGFGNVLVEAMAAGVPIVSTDCPHGPFEILEGGKWGRLVPPGDSAALASAMLESLDKGGVDARERAREFTVGRVADQYLELLSG